MDCLIVSFGLRAHWFHVVTSADSWTVPLGFYLKFLPAPESWTVYLPPAFPVSWGFKLRSFIHFELIFIQCERCGSIPLFCKRVLSFAGTIGWTGCLWPTTCWRHFCQNFSGHSCVGLSAPLSHAFGLSVFMAAQNYLYSGTELGSWSLHLCSFSRVHGGECFPCFRFSCISCREFHYDIF